jgi:hypothetical protein
MLLAAVFVGFPSNLVAPIPNIFTFPAVHYNVYLTRGSAAARLLSLRVRIPPWAWLSVVSVLCVCVFFFQVEVSASRLQESL